MALARNQHDIVGFGMFDGKGDRIMPVANLMRALGPCHDVSADERRVFASWVIVSDNHNVGVCDGHSAHLRTLACIAVAACAEDSN